MACFTPDASRLRALIGDAILDIPAAVVVQLENVLCHAAQTGAAAAFVGRLARSNYPLAADGRLWDEPGVPMERNETLAQASRSVQGLITVLQLLSAGISHRGDTSQAPMGDHVVQGLLLAGRELAESASEALHANH